MMLRVPSRDGLGRNLRNLEAVRLAMGYAHENLALDADISRSYISNLKNGTNSATLDMVDRIARVT